MYRTAQAAKHLIRVPAWSLRQPSRALTGLAASKQDASQLLRAEIVSTSNLVPQSRLSITTKPTLGWLDQWDTSSRRKQASPSTFKGCFSNVLALGQCLAEEGSLERAKALLDALAKFHGQYSGCLAQVAAWRSLAELRETQSLISRDLGKKREAVGAAREAASLWERLVRLDPTTYEDHYGASLVNLGSRLHEANDMDTAIESFEQAVVIARKRRGLKTEQEVLASLGTALQCLSLVIAREQPEQALKYAIEVAELAEAASNDKDRESLPAAMAAHSLVLQHHLALKHFNLAKQTVDRQFRILSHLDDQPDSNFREAISILTDCANSFLQASEYNQTRRILEAIFVCPMISKILPEAQGRLSYLRAVCLMEEGRVESAAREMQASIRLFKDAEIPDEAQLASAYSEYSRILAALSSPTEGYAACKEAVGLQRSFLNSTTPVEAAERVNLATYLLQLAQHELDSSTFDEAIQLVDDALEICRQHPEVEATHDCLAAGYALRVKACLGNGDHAEVVRTAEGLHIILETFLEEENRAAVTFQRLLESLEAMIPSLEYLGREEEAAAARTLMDRLRSIQAGDNH
ncbi:hypothetical protein M407DRAFT_22090 [Tulasnella calospora MUT 4182]|uniref:MalT-like TPR region domain-containing protein n=1 Tax=Tulasnella calospora MUT 4182 TaxID=1051891 RepID=A0A0C3QNU8_9AGAM|nr:hypothetical protein M407DRAFT_22090 [Tulasnella calospora MUT 4182]